jgi:eukaryotic-like serine/threonine-protein kinase
MHEPVVQGTSLGRYEIVQELAAGGMGTVYLGRQHAARGVSLTVAIKRINRALAGDPHVMGMFIDEARITALIRHPNVVQTLDVVEEGGELLLVMEYVHGVSLARLLSAARTRGESLPLPVTARIASDVLHGLHAAHETTNEQGKSLDIVHRDVSPQNILVGVDGIARVVDFGIARAANRIETTRAGEVKGKLRYIAPEQFVREAVDRRADIYGVGLLLWEMIAGSAMRRASSPGGLTSAILMPKVDAPSTVMPGVPPALDDVVLKALSNEPRDRFPFAAQMAVALEEAVTPAPYAKVAELVQDLGREEITERRAMLERAASSPRLIPPATPSSVVLERASSPGGVAAAAGMETVATPAVVRRDARRQRVIVAGAAGGVAVAALAFALLRPSPPKVVSAPPAVEVPVASIELPATAPPEPTATTAADPAPTSNVASPPAAPVQAPSHAQRWRKGHSSPPRPASAKPDCTIPYVVDRNGIRVPRRECM